jgi:tripartite-type tricarboxylate transporter receptor subunit TctC
VLTTAGTPAPIVERLSIAVRNAIDDPKSREAIVAQGVDPKAATPAEFSELFRAEYARWGALIKQLGIRAD